MEENLSEDNEEQEVEEEGCSLGGVGCLVILLIIGGLVWWLQDYVRAAWFSLEQAEGAETAYEEGNYEVAQEKLQALLKKSPDEPETLRATARLLRGNQPFKAFWAMQRLKEMGEADPDDLRFFAQLAQDVRKTHLAEAVTQQLLKQEPKNPDNLFLAARRLFLDFRGVEALVGAETILNDWPTHRPTRLLRARLLTLRPELVPRIQGKTELKELVEEKQDRVSLEALVILTFSGLRPVEDAERNATLRQIEFHPLASDGLKLRTFGQLHGPRRMSQDTLKLLLDKYGNQPELLGPWLANRERFEQAASLFSLEQAKERPELFDPWLAVLMHRDPRRRTQRLKRVEEILKQADAMMPEARRALFGAILLRERGDREGMRKLFKLALTKSGNLTVEKRGPFLDALAIQSLASGERDFSLQVLKERFAGGIGENVPYEACERYFIATVANKEVVEALAIAEQVMERYPAQFAARNNLAYLKLLLSSDIDKTSSEVERLAQEGPAIPSFRTTLALARLRSGKPKEALQAIMLEDQLPAIYQGD